MAKSLFDFGSENINDLGEKSSEKTENFGSENSFGENAKKQSSSNTFDGSDLNGVDERLKQQAQNMYDKYKDYSQQEIVNEFLSSSKQKLHSGELTYEKLQQMATLLSPYLNDGQREMMYELLGKLND